ncbi:uncharacterized protein A4U43_C08F19170 [Asparagus officinalis]|nr:uncharacterized protein A4U43_C08F19170 [Asparagus officinalis]
MQTNKGTDENFVVKPSLARKEDNENQVINSRDKRVDRSQARNLNSVWHTTTAKNKGLAASVSTSSNPPVVSTSNGFQALHVNDDSGIKLVVDLSAEPQNKKKGGGARKGAGAARGDRTHWKKRRIGAGLRFGNGEVEGGIGSALVMEEGAVWVGSVCEWREKMMAIVGDLGRGTGIRGG